MNEAKKDFSDVIQPSPRIKLESASLKKEVKKITLFFPVSPKISET